MTTYERLRADIITAMKARDTATATALRTMDAAIQRLHGQQQTDRRSGIYWAATGKGFHAK